MAEAAVVIMAAAVGIVEVVTAEAGTAEAEIVVVGIPGAGMTEVGNY
jgi:hypothetical protein